MESKQDGKHISRNVDTNLLSVIPQEAKESEKNINCLKILKECEKNKNYLKILSIVNNSSYYTITITTSANGDYDNNDDNNIYNSNSISSSE